MGVRKADAPPDATQDMSGMALLEAPDPRAEAGAIALAMRGVLETPSKTAALVTPDRRLARRVAVELRRWNIEVDDPPVARLPTRRWRNSCGL